MERKHVLAQADEHPARGVTANAAVGDLHAREAAAHVVAPSIGDRIAQEDEGMLFPRDAERPLEAVLGPDFLEPVLSADGPGSRQAVVGCRDLIVRICGRSQ